MRQNLRPFFLHLSLFFFFFPLLQQCYSSIVSTYEASLLGFYKLFYLLCTAVTYYCVLCAWLNYYATASNSKLFVVQASLEDLLPFRLV